MDEKKERTAASVGQSRKRHLYRREWIWLQHNKRLTVKAKRRIIEVRMDQKRNSRKVKQMDIYIVELRKEVTKLERLLKEKGVGLDSKGGRKNNKLTLSNIAMRHAKYLKTLAESMERRRELEVKSEELYLKDAHFSYNLARVQPTYKHLKEEFKKKWLV